jgi:hypothetical protein
MATKPEPKRNEDIGSGMVPIWVTINTKAIGPLSAIVFHADFCLYKHHAKVTRDLSCQFCIESLAMMMQTLVSQSCGLHKL